MSADARADIAQFLHLMVERKASDLHLTAGCAPHLRIDDDLVPLGEEPLTSEQCRDLVFALLTPQQIEMFERELELDVGIGLEGLSRFRVNIYQQRGSVGAAIRAIPFEIMSLEECGLPAEVLRRLIQVKQGLVLATGATGMGKSTTLASMIDAINQERACHIVTVEDPIEYTFQHKKAVINQRQLGHDTHSFSEALRHVLRQDPDVILIGEMRDLDTIQAALNIAETGHLVFSTLHTADSVQTVNRVVDVFPASQQNQVRIQLSFVLLAILSHQLIPRLNGDGRVLATEILIANHAIRNLIREAKAHQIFSVMQTGQREQMKTMNRALAELYQQSVISYEEAMLRTTEPQDLERLLRG